MKPFRFSFSTKESALHSVAIVDGVPELRFYAFPNLPATSEQDIAAAIRMALENKRPEFYYIPFPPNHPFVGRQYKSYSPQWLRATSVGDLLSKVDWNMKCINIGAKSDAENLKLWARHKTSQLKGLPTMLDFRREKSSGSIVMSVESAEVHECENELVFTKEPKMRIDDDASPTNTKYLTENFQSIAYHDEPLFLKMQELVKFTLAAEWLNKKGVVLCPEWIMDSTTKQACGLKDAYNQESHNILPLPPINRVIRPSSDVTVRTFEAEHWKWLSKHGIQSCYGYDDSYERLICKEDGTVVLKQNCMRIVVVSNGQPLPIMLGIPLPPNVTPEPKQLLHLIREQLPLPQSSQQTITGRLGSMYLQISETKNVCENGVELDIIESIHLSPGTPPLLKNTTTIRASVHDYNMLYKGINPRSQIGRSKNGEAIIPNVKSWSELHSESVPWPQIWKVPFEGIGIPAASGGISTRKIPVIQSENIPDAVRCRQTVPVRAQANVQSPTSRLCSSNRSRETIPSEVAGVLSPNVSICSSDSGRESISSVVSNEQTVPAQVQPIPLPANVTDVLSPDSSVCSSDSGIFSGSSSVSGD